MGLERIFAWFDGDAPGSERPKIRAFQVIFALVIATEYWTKALRAWDELEPMEFAALGVVTVLTATVVHGRHRRSAFVGFVILQTWYVWANFPMTGNHRYLELFLSVLFALLDDDEPEERRILLRSVRWAVVVVLFYSGVQKLVHGYYFKGQFLAYSLWRPPFKAALELFSPVAEFERLSAIAAVGGDGPYLVSSMPFLVVSNAVWILEIGLALLLIPLATRRVAWIATCVFVVATEVVAREFMFGVEFLAAILLFARTDVIRRLVLPFAVLLALLVFMSAGLVPGVLFH